MKYYLFEANQEGWACKNVFTDYDHLIRYLASFQSGKLDWSEGKPYYNNWVLDRISINFQDEYVTSDWFGNTERYTRPHVFMDEEDRIVDPRDFYDDIIAYEKPPYERKYPYHVFRRGPVPGTGHRRHGHYWRSVHYGQIVRMIKHPNFKEYGRKRRYQNMDQIYFDYPIRYYDKSWKSSTKCRKQWEKNINKNRKKKRRNEK